VRMRHCLGNIVGTVNRALSTVNRAMGWIIVAAFLLVPVHLVTELILRAVVCTTELWWLGMFTFYALPRPQGWDTATGAVLRSVGVFTFTVVKMLIVVILLRVIMQIGRHSRQGGSGDGVPRTREFRKRHTK
jgi:hypothetical protein